MQRGASVQRKMNEPSWFRYALEFPSESSSICVEDVTINYTTWGEIGNPGIILIHGSNAHLEWWRFVAPYLADQFRVVALDSSGNGDSGWREVYSGAIFAKEVWEVGEAAQVGTNPFIIGHSFGGYVALEVGAQYGGMIGGIALVDFTVASPENYSEWGLRAEREDKKPRKTKLYDSLGSIVSRFRLLPDQPLNADVLSYIARKSIRKVDGGYTWKFDPTLFDYLEMGSDQAEKFMSLACRSAVILGEHSDDEGAFNAPYMREISQYPLPNFMIPGTHHHLMFEEPLALVAGLKGLLHSWIREDRVHIG